MTTEFFESYSNPRPKACILFGANSETCILRCNIFDETYIFEFIQFQINVVRWSRKLALSVRTTFPSTTAYQQVVAPFTMSLSSELGSDELYSYTTILAGQTWRVAKLKQVNTTFQLTTSRRKFSPPAKKVSPSHFLLSYPSPQHRHHRGSGECLAHSELRCHSQNMLTRFCPLLTTYLPLVDICDVIPLPLQGKIFIHLPTSSCKPSL